MSTPLRAIAVFILLAGCGSSALHDAGVSAADAAVPSETDGSLLDAAVQGALFVRVIDEQGATVADATVSTDPRTQTLVTDALGSVLFRGLAPGAYAVTATHPAAGSGRQPVVVGAGIAQLDLVLRKTGTVPPADAGAPDVPAIDGSAPDAATPRQDAAPLPLDTPLPFFPDAALPRDLPPSPADLAPPPADLAPPPVDLRPDTAPEAGPPELTTFIDVATQVERMMVDPKRPYLYALDSVNNSLLFVNLQTNKVDKTIFVGSKPVAMDIDVAGNELFIADFGATEITVVNLETREKARTLTVNTQGGVWDGNPYRLVCTAGDTLVFTSEDQWNDLKLVNASTGGRLFAGFSIYEPELVRSADGTHVYMGETSLSTVTLIRYDLTGGNMLMEADNSGDAGSYSGRHLAITRDGTYLFFANKKILAKNLKSVLGTFTEAIVTATGDGSIAIGPSKIHDGNMFKVIRPLPFNTEIMALSTDDRTLYLYDTKSSRIYLVSLMAQ